MNKIFSPKKLVCLGSLSLFLIGFSASAYASGFQLWELEEAGLGTYHAGGAAIADNASTGYINPAGLVRIKHPEISLGAADIMTDIRFKGNVSVMYPQAPFFDFSGYSSANGSDYSYVPNFHYAQPITQNIVLGFNVVATLGMDTDYPTSNILRYMSTHSTVQAIDFGPSIGYKLNDHWSLGLGLDAQRLKAEFNEYAGVKVGTLILNSSLENTMYSWAYGFHAGVLYQFTPSTRVGLSYRSKVVHHAEGSSKFDSLTPSLNIHLKSRDAKATVIMPATTILSFYQDINKQWAWMASATYSQWGAFNNLRLTNIAGLEHILPTPDPTTNLTVTVPQHYRNTWNLAVGGTYAINTKWQLKAGLGFEQSPVKDRYRTVQIPDNDRFVTAIGVHFQPTKSFGIDAGWDHFFVKKSSINSTVTVGPETVNAKGHVDSSADIVGMQLTYDFV